jgi:glycosyltransferase involved in cell wall biosynthesis
MNTFYFPINSTSLGASAFHILENIDDDFNLLPIGGNIDISSFEPCPEKLKEKIINSANRTNRSHNVNGLSVKLWHPFASLERITNKQILYTFHEVDSLTELEVNALNQQEAIIVPCNYNKEVFQKSGIRVPIYVVPLGVDTSIFRPMEKYKNKSGPFTFLMAGKFEARKLHLEILQAFMMVFANNPQVKLRCCITNRFVDMNNIYKLINERIFGGKPPSNIEFIDWLPTERHVADFLAHGDCLVSPSRAESFNLPLLQAMSCGTSVITNVEHAHSDYVNKDNAIIVPSSNKSIAKDDVFFRHDGNTNTGNWYNVSPNHIAQAMIDSFKLGRRTNEAGIFTSSFLSWKNTAYKILDICHLHKT